MRAAACVTAAAAAPTGACSNFMMENGYRISVRTMDQGPTSYVWYLATQPEGAKGLRTGKHGYVGFVEGPRGTLISAGLNDAGVSCDANALINSAFPAQNASLDNVAAQYICQWALEGFGSVAELKVGLRGVNFLKPPPFPAPGSDFNDQHWVFRDARGEGVVIEFIDGEMRVYDDDNDSGATGFGIMTNEPPLPWQLEAVRHMKWKRGLARPAVAMPGAWYPDARFQRIHLVKSAMPAPGTYAEAVMQAVHTLNTVTVPMGAQLGTDSGSNEGRGDHTQFGVVYDHANRTVYWRTEVNQNLQRLRLADAGIAEGGTARSLNVYGPTLPWYHDAAGALGPTSSTK